MKILMRRTQKPHWLFWWRVIFDLWCELELEPEERQLIDRYEFHKARLIIYQQENLLRNALITGAAVAFIVFFAVGYYFGRQAGGYFALVAGAFATWVHYDYFRLTIWVRDLMYGRMYECHDIVSLVVREEDLKNLVANFRRVMEAAKNWGGNSVYDVPAVDEELTRKIILKRYR